MFWTQLVTSTIQFLCVIIPKTLLHATWKDEQKYPLIFLFAFCGNFSSSCKNSTIRMLLLQNVEIISVVRRLGGGGVTSTHNKRGCAIVTNKVAPKNPGTYLKLRPKNPGNLPEIETQKSGNPKRQAFHLHEKTYHPERKVLDIDSTFQFYLFYQRILLFNFMMFVKSVFNFPQPLSVQVVTYAVFPKLTSSYHCG